MLSTALVVAMVAATAVMAQQCERAECVGVGATCGAAGGTNGTRAAVCADGLLCDAGTSTCMTPDWDRLNDINETTACTADAQCAGGALPNYRCVAERCTVLYMPNDACDDDAQCVPAVRGGNATCGADGVCVGAPLNATCDAPGVCEFGAYCAPSGTCAARTPLGDGCGGAAAPCIESALCVEGVCVEAHSRQRGDACAGAQRVCAPPLVCEFDASRPETLANATCRDAPPASAYAANVPCNSTGASATCAADTLPPLQRSASCECNALAADGDAQCASTFGEARAGLVRLADVNARYAALHACLVRARCVAPFVTPNALYSAYAAASPQLLYNEPRAATCAARNCDTERLFLEQARCAVVYDATADAGDDADTCRFTDQLQCGVVWLWYYIVLIVLAALLVVCVAATACYCVASRRRSRQRYTPV